MEIPMIRNNTMAFATLALLVTAPVLAAPALSTVAASSPTVTNALAATDLAGAQKMIGKIGAFQGTIKEVYSPSDHDLLILDFAKNYKEALTGFVGKSDIEKFTGLATIVEGKRVVISGKFITYQGHPEIVLTSPTQIVLVK
jgi:DNA/RNA endonuclease YhcR with UshA esterase domain